MRSRAMPPGKPHSRWRPVRRTVYLNRIRDHHHARVRTDQARNADDVDAIRAMVEPLEQSGALIPRSINSIEQHLEDYLCSTLKEHSLAAARYAFEDTAEIAGLATHPGHRDQDYGEQFGALLHKAAQKALRSVFCNNADRALVFERGFMRSDQSALPLTKRATYDDRRNSKVLVRQLKIKLSATLYRPLVA